MTVHHVFGDTQIEIVLKPFSRATGNAHLPVVTLLMIIYRVLVSSRFLYTQTARPAKLLKPLTPTFARPFSTSRPTKMIVTPLTEMLGIRV